MTLPDDFAAILEDVGYRSRVDHGVVYFRVEGQECRFETFPDDEGYGRLALGYALDAVDIERAVGVANNRNVQLKAVKTSVYSDPDLVLFTIEAFFDDVDYLRTILHRAMDALLAASEAYFLALRSLREAG